MDAKDLVKILENGLASDFRYKEAIQQVISPNCKGEVWLVGGMLYKSILNGLYGTSFTTQDLDFLAHKSDKFILPDGWIGQSTRHGEPKLEKNGTRVDIMWLENMHSILEHGAEYKVESYLSGVPLTIQSIAYDINRKTLLGEAGINAILSRTVGIMNQDEYNYCLETYRDHYSVERFSKELTLKIEI